MKLQTTTSAKPVKSRRKPLQRRKKAAKKGYAWKTAVVISLPASLLFALGVASARFNSETETLNRHATSIEMKLHKKAREISDLKVKLERMKGRFVLRQVKRFNLGLSYPRPGQVLYLDATGKARAAWNRRYRGEVMVSESHKPLTGYTR